MRFTAEDAFEASEYGEPIIIDGKATSRILTDHDARFVDFMADNHGTALVGPDGIIGFDAALVLGWLGY